MATMKYIPMEQWRRTERIEKWRGEEERQRDSGEIDFSSCTWVRTICAP